MEAKNKCPYCGGQLVLEQFGSYGEIYRLRKDGNPCKKMLRRVLYGGNGEEMVYCRDCRREATGRTPG